MDALKLNDHEQRLYQDLFHSCDVDGTGKVSGNRANDLLRTTGLSQDTLHQIIELCGAKRLGMFGRSQFYVALKLVAVAQSQLPVSLESIGSDVPLPEFTSQLENVAQRLTDIDQEAAAGDSGKMMPVVQTKGQLPPPPTKKHTRNLSGQYRGVPGQPPEGAQQYPPQPQIQNNSREDSPQNSKSPVFSPKQSPPISPPLKPRDSKEENIGVSQQVVVRNNSTGGSAIHNSAGWAQFENDEHQGLMRHGVSVRKSWEDIEGHAIDSSSISSEAESLDDVWTISDEQRDYYITQFKTMQPNLTGVIKGNIAKEFFEKSRLPIQELSKIWQLSDFNKDGALSLEEFCTAMHLVVLKRNDVELPNHLPPSLMPYSTLINDEPFSSDLPPGSTIKRVSPLSPSASQWSTAFLSDSSSDLSSPVIKPVNFEVNPVSHDPETNIVHPVALRMSPDGHSFPTLEGLVDRSRTLSDPVNYETNHDPPDILTPSKPRSNTQSYSTEPMSPLTKLHGHLQGRPRPVPKKSASASIPGQLQPPPAMPPSQVVIGSEDTFANAPAHGDLPPLPETCPSPHIQGSAPPQLPPRPTMHNRSISVDLKLKIDGGLMPPPAVPPRISPKDGPKKVNEKFTFGAVDSDRLSQPEMARLKRFEPIPSQEVLDVINTSDNVERKVISGQSTLERHRRTKSLDFHQTPVTSNKPTDVQAADFTDSVSSIPEEVSSKEPGDLMDRENLMVADGDIGELSAVVDKPRQNSIALRQGSRDKRDVQMALRTHQERNIMLGRVNSELNQELQEVMEQRIALEIQLEHLRPFSS